MARQLQRIIAVTGSLGVVAGLALVSAPAEARAPSITLKSVSTTTVGTAFKLTGRLSGTGARNNKKVVLQRKAAGGWVRVDRLYWQDDGPYAFRSRSYATAGTRTFRTVVKRAGRTLDVSPARSVAVTSRDTTPPGPGPSPLPNPSPPGPPGADLLPDLGIKKLNQCSPSEKARNADGSCFGIHTTAVPGQRVLKFPVTTFNVGAGPMEVHATRSSSSATQWTAVQRILTDNGVVRELAISPEFSYAGDGHSHWHIQDFDAYQLLDATGTVLEVGEKHGYCLQDNTDYRDWLDAHIADPSVHPGMPLQEVYTNATACGFEEPQSTDILHGLSVGWGDSYPTTLDNQYIDITDVPDGTYTLKVTANQGLTGAQILTESNPANNAASSKITITGNTVTWLSDETGM